MKKILLACVMFWGLNACLADADTIFLKSGRKIEGEITEQKEEYIKVKIQGTPFTFYRFEIDKIQKSIPETLKPKPPSLPPQGTSEEKKELIKRFLEANGTRESMSRVFDDALQKIPEKYQPQVREILQSDALIERLIPIYDKNYTVAELKELIAFYKSPTGRKIWS